MKIFNLLALMLLLSYTTIAQSVVKGNVVDENNDPLIGATIQSDDATTGTVTDIFGDFSMTLPEGTSSIIISSVGYKTQSVVINGSILTIKMMEDSEVLDEVTVTGFAGAVGQARRRSESVQRIPESVTTLTSSQINTSGVTNVQSFATLVPNMSFQTSQTPGNNFVNVRGIAQIRNGESPVAFVIDGVTIPDANLLNQDLYDLAMIEVVKGPQGTLYGKNAIGGAINILTNPPSNVSKNKFTVGYGNGNNLKAQLSSSGAISKDKVYYRLSGSYRSFDGLIDNITLGETVDFSKELSVRGQLKFDLSSTFTATLQGQYSETEGGATYYSRNPAGGQLDANDFETNVVDADQRGVGTLDNSFLALKLEANLGKSIFRSVTSYNKADRDYSGDLDFNPADVLRQTQQSNSNSFNQEFRLSSTNTNSPMSWDVGAFYQRSDKFLFTEATADFGFFADPFTATGTQSILANLSDFNNVYSTIALFGFSDYKLTDKLTASVGLRFDSDNIKQENRLLSTNPEKTQSELQPKLSLAYQGSDQVLVYANYGRGYRSGGFNSDSSDLFDAEYDGETSNNYELGLKTTSKNQRLIFNAAAFIVDFKNQQQYAVSLGTGGLVLGNYNMPETQIFGIETDLKFRTSKYLDIIAGFGYNTSEIKDAGTAGNIDRSSFVGNTTPLVPETTFNIALQSTIPVSDNTNLIGFVNLNNKGRIYWHEDNIDRSDPFNLLDARFTLAMNKFNVSLWGNNIMNTEYFQEYYSQEVSGGGGDIGWIGRPATFGVDISVNF